MKTRVTVGFMSAMILVSAAGVAAPARAQPVVPPGRSVETIPAGAEFRSSSWLSDRKVMNNNGEQIAKVSDLILDRGWGRIEYIILRTDTSLGMGGREVAIPFSAFGWQTGSDGSFVLGATPEQLKQYPEYTPQSWQALKDSAKDNSNTLHQRLAADAASGTDPYAGNLNTAKQLTVKGEVQEVTRVRTSSFGEQVHIKVSESNGAARQIALGPSWFVNGAQAAPMRGDRVSIDTISLPRDPDELLVATVLRHDERTLQLRETDGTPRWALKSVESGGSHYSTPYSRYLLMSTLPGMKIDCRGEEVGKVHEIILDRASGEIAFLSIDPNKNFLGIGDTKRLVPWSVATVTFDGTVRIDASKEMVMKSPETPKDPATLGSGNHAERVYKAFGVPAPRFEEPRGPIGSGHPSNRPWASRGLVITAIERDSARVIEGQVKEICEVRFDKGTPAASGVRIDVNGHEELVVLGPSWYMDNQESICKPGDSIKVDACRTTVDGQKYWIAKSMTCKDARVVLLDSNYAPAWALP
ncbi:MAG: PRC-barrel domain-containing protein [Phycisphaerales bacterium]